MKELGTKLQPGGAAVIALVRQVNAEKVLAEVKIAGEVIQTSLSSEGEEATRDVDHVVIALERPDRARERGARATGTTARAPFRSGAAAALG